MKKNLFLILTIALATAFTGCNDDTTPATESELTVSNTPTTAVVAEGNTVKFNVESNTTWTITTADTWVTASPASGENNQEVTVTISENTTDQPRKATLTVKTGDSKVSRPVTIDQNGKGVVAEPEPIDLGDGTTEFEINEDMTLTADNTYILKGYVYVTDGATLTIEPGTIIKGDKATRATLVVEPGGKIMAEGTADAPIVFTSLAAAGSRKPGDWGGIIIMGNAVNNQGTMAIEGGPRTKHGGTDNADNSGILSYVRIEFAGIEYGTDNEINGLTMGSVGSGTQIDHVQVSHSGDDSFEWFGGVVNASHLIAFSGWDDDFDADNGFSGNVQFGLIVRNPDVADKSASNGFESDNNSSGSAATPFTSAVFSNISSFGPVADPTNYVDRGNVNGSSPAGVFQAGVQLRRNTRLSLFNSVVAGWPIGLIIENDKSSTTQTWATEGDLVVGNVIMAGMQANYQDGATNMAPVIDASKGTTFVEEYFNRLTGNNSTYATIAELGLSVAPGLANPVAIPTASSPLVGAAAWSDTKVSTGFEQVGYIGAFSSEETATNNWTSGWTNFDPQNTVY